MCVLSIYLRNKTELRKTQALSLATWLLNKRSDTKCPRHYDNSIFQLFFTLPTLIIKTTNLKSQRKLVIGVELIAQVS